MKNENKHIRKTIEDYIFNVKQKEAIIKIKESALKPILRHFNNKGIYIHMTGIISGRTTIHKARCEYDIRSGYLKIYDTISEDMVVIEMAQAYQILTSRSNKILVIKLDNEQEIKIEL